MSAATCARARSSASSARPGSPPARMCISKSSSTTASSIRCESNCRAAAFWPAHCSPRSITTASSSTPSSRACPPATWQRGRPLSCNISASCPGLTRAFMLRRSLYDINRGDTVWTTGSSPVVTNNERAFAYRKYPRPRRRAFQPLMGGLSSQHHAAIVSGDHERGRDRRLDQQRLFLADTMAAHRRAFAAFAHHRSYPCARFFLGRDQRRELGRAQSAACLRRAETGRLFVEHLRARLNEVAPAPPLQPQR